MHVIGLTGGIACGKSTVSNRLRALGACILDADEMAHELAEPGQALFRAYERHFGAAVLMEDGTLNRKAVGEIVFHHPEERKWMDDTAHPILLDGLKKRMERCRASGKEIVVLDVPLLFEAGWDSFCDEVWVVFVPQETQERRLMQRDRLTAEQARARINAQMSMEEKCRRADVVIDNSGTMDETVRNVEKLFTGRWRSGKAL